MGSAFLSATAQERPVLATPFTDKDVRMTAGWKYYLDNPHGAIDYAKRNADGQPITFVVRAPAGGYAARFADKQFTALGNVVMIVHVDNRNDPVYYTSLLAHLQNDSKWRELPLVNRADCPEDRGAGGTWTIDLEAEVPIDECDFSKWKRVEAGEHIANAGKSGDPNYVPHLHLEVYNHLGFSVGNRIDPYDVGPGYAKNLYEYKDCGDVHLWFECPLTTQSLSSGSFPIRDNDSEVILLKPNPTGVLMFGSIATAFIHENLPELGVTLTDSTGNVNTVKALGANYCWPGLGDLPCNNASVRLGNSRLGKRFPSSWAFEFTDTAAGNVGSVIDLTISATTHNVVLPPSTPSPSIRYISFVEGDPGIAGDGTVINGISDVNPSLSRFTLSDPFLSDAELENGITISVYSQPAPAETRIVLLLDYPGGGVPGCNITVQANPNPPPLNPAITINGAQGSTFYLSLDQVLQFIRNSGCQEPAPNELQISSFLLIDDTLTGRTPLIDAVAFGTGQDAYPTE